MDQHRTDGALDVLSSLMSRWTSPIECIHPTTLHSSPNMRRASGSVISWCQSARKSNSSPPGA